MPRAAAGAGWPVMRPTTRTTAPAVTSISATPPIKIGKYKVRVSRYVDRDGTVLPSDAKQVDYPHAVESIPAPYSSPNSPLDVTVPETGGTVNVEIPVKMLGTK